MNDPHWLTAQEIVAAYAARRLSPVELVGALLDRIAALNPLLGAFIRVDAEAALEAARAAERDLAAGRVRGPLHGVPVAVKDIIDVAGQVTTCHSKIMLDHVAEHDATVIARLRAAGAIIIGKLALHEFAIGGPSFDLPFPPARNPWNPAHHPGGSSSGSGVGAGGGPRAAGARHRYRWLGAPSRRRLWVGGPEANLRHGIAARRLSACIYARSRRADGAQRRRCRIAARRDRRARPARIRAAFAVRHARMAPI